MRMISSSKYLIIRASACSASGGMRTWHYHDGVLGYQCPLAHEDAVTRAVIATCPEEGKVVQEVRRIDGRLRDVVLLLEDVPKRLRGHVCALRTRTGVHIRAVIRCNCQAPTTSTRHVLLSLK